MSTFVSQIQRRIPTISVPRTIDVSIMSICGFILDMLGDH